MPHGKRYQKIAKLIEKNKIYSLDEALLLLPQTAKTKFESSVEIHVRLGINLKKPEHNIRTVTTLPHGTGKKIRIAVFAEGEKIEEAKSAGADLIGNEELIEKIRTTGECDFDIAVATPDMMKKMAPIAKILGPRNLMPSPKNETVTTQIKKIVEELKKGKITMRNDATGNLHQLVGKISFPKEKLKENILVFYETLKKVRPGGIKGNFIESITLTTTMGPGIKVIVE